MKFLEFRDKWMSLQKDEDESDDMTWFLITASTLDDDDTLKTIDKLIEQNSEIKLSVGDVELDFEKCILELLKQYRYLVNKEANKLAKQKVKDVLTRGLLELS
jgi:hypothetical protein